VAYVGDAACAQCHAEIAESFAKHPMGQSAAIAAEAPTPGLEGPTEPARISFEAKGLEYSVERRDGRIYHSEVRKDSSGRVVAKVEVEAAYAIGSGHRGRSYLLEKDGYLLQSPISWYTEKGTWDLSPDSQLGENHHFERPIDPGCLYCHVNRFQPVEGTINRYKSPIFDGLTIGCERCHGPGSLHADKPLSTAGGYSLIVNPARLEPSLREAVCEQCHLGGRARIERLDRRLTDYRPGLPLDEFVSIYVNTESQSGSFRAIGHVEQMHASRCYQQSDGQLGCISCHDPHVLPSPNEALAYYRTRCLNCHGAESTRAATLPMAPGCRLPEEERRRQSQGDHCTECHMPRSSLANVAHTAATDHRILRFASSADSSAIIPPVASANASFPIAWFHENQADPESGSIVIKDARSEPQKPGSRNLRTREDAAELPRARDLAIALTELAFEQQRSGGSRLAKRALPMLEQALADRPDDLAAWLARSTALSVRNQPKEALAALESAQSIAPEDERLLSQSVLLRAKQGQRDAAIDLARRLIAVDPMVSTYHQTLAQLLAQGKDWAGAARASREALTLDPTNLTARWIVIKAAIELGDLPLARAEADIYFAFDPPDRVEVQRMIDEAVPKPSRINQANPPTAPISSPDS
jgi:tetratricopeptide (TPR) repeat protein